MKKYLFGILAIAMAVGFSAFTTKNVHKPVDMELYYFTGTHNYIPVTTPSDPNVLQSSELTDVAKWNQSAGYTFGAGDYLAAVEFDESAFTKQQGINEVSNYYFAQTPDDLPANGGTFTVVKNSINYTFTIYRKTTH